MEMSRICSQARSQSLGACSSPWSGPRRPGRPTNEMDNMKKQAGKLWTGPTRNRDGWKKVVVQVESENWGKTEEV